MLLPFAVIKILWLGHKSKACSKPRFRHDWYMFIHPLYVLKQQLVGRKDQRSESQHIRVKALSRIMQRSKASMLIHQLMHPIINLLSYCHSLLWIKFSINKTFILLILFSKFPSKIFIWHALLPNLLLRLQSLLGCLHIISTKSETPNPQPFAPHCFYLPHSFLTV